jgi:hypothetical protein
LPDEVTGEKLPEDTCALRSGLTFREFDDQLDQCDDNPCYQSDYQNNQSYSSKNLKNIGNIGIWYCGEIEGKDEI